MSKLLEILEDLESLGDGSGASHSMINSLRKDLKTLIPEWMTIDEFEANPIFGQCWITDETEVVVSAVYKENRQFYESIMPDYRFNKQSLTHVMPIITPEAPK